MVEKDVENLRTCIFTSFVVFIRMATVSKDGTWKIWDIDGKLPTYTVVICMWLMRGIFRGELKHTLKLSFPFPFPSHYCTFSFFSPFSQQGDLREQFVQVERF